MVEPQSHTLWEAFKADWKQPHKKFSALRRPRINAPCVPSESSAKWKMHIHISWVSPWIFLNPVFIVYTLKSSADANTGTFKQEPCIWMSGSKKICPYLLPTASQLNASTFPWITDMELTVETHSWKSY